MMLPFSRLLALRGVAVARLTPTGEVIEANDAFRQAAGVIEASGWSASGCFSSPTFAELRSRADAGRDPVHEGSVDLGIAGRTAITMRATVVRVAGELVFLGEIDGPAYARVMEEALALNAELAELQREQGRTIQRLERTEKELKDAISQVKTLRGLLPICARCKKIKNDTGAWERLETYVERHSEAQLSHGVCQDCLAEQLATGDEA